MKVSQALKERKSIRAFLPKEVEKEKTDRILEYARYAPSGVNTQPWEVVVLRGNRQKELLRKIEEAFEQGTDSSMDYKYYPDEWFEPFKSRRKATGLQMYETMGITKEDKEGQRRNWKANYKMFDAPVSMFFFMHKDLGAGSILDYGMFLQSVMLMAEEEGLSTCIQASIAQYPDIIRKELGVSDDRILLCGIAMGYKDDSKQINGFKTPRPG